MAGESEPQSKQSTLSEIYDGAYLNLVEESTGRSADEIRAMSFEERQRVLETLGVNLKDLEAEQTNVRPRARYHLG